MKNTFLKSFLVLTFFLLNFTAFAEETVDEEEDYNYTTNGTTAAPINENLVWLAIGGILVAFYSYKKVVAVKISK